MRQTLFRRTPWVLVFVALCVPTPSLAFGHKTYFSKTTTKTVVHGQPGAISHVPAPAAPVYSQPMQAYAPVAPTYYVPVAPMHYAPLAPTYYAPVAPNYASTAPAYAPVAPNYAPVAPSYAPVAPNYPPPVAPHYAPPAQPSGQR